MTGDPSKDIVFLVADQNMKAAVDALLTRYQSLQIRAVQFDTFVHPHRDPGCLTKSADFLRPLSGKYRHAVVMFDREGCGKSDHPARDLEAQVAARLQSAGWQDRAAAVVFDPELEAWVWSDSPEVDKVLGWADRRPALRSWLCEKGLLEPEHNKPADPKRAMELALREMHRPRSSAHYGALASQVGLRRCQDTSFVTFRKLLSKWFPPNEF